MSDVVIRIENLGKRYRYGGVPAVSDSLRADIAEWVKGVVRLGRNGHRRFRDIHEQHLDKDPRYFWALKDINLEIKQGEVVGIIGRNGAGKSTLLKILSRITPPTTGRITYRGRIASLLEVGTGFHRELTGRENIYLNGSILGMTRREITRKLDEIVAFAEIEKFLDTPVKFYSSGMYVRLAFAVAAHLDPEILIVDEVLAVGDANFQKKCLGKMGDVARLGRTVILVSHNLGVITSLCTRAALLESGRMVAVGSPLDVVRCYLNCDEQLGSAVVDLRNRSDVPEQRRFARLLSIGLFDRHGVQTVEVGMGEPFQIRLEVEFLRRMRQPEVGIAVSTISGERLTRFVSLWEGVEGLVEAGVMIYEITVPALMIVPGPYTLTPWIRRPGEEIDDMSEGALRFEVSFRDVSGHMPYFNRICRVGEFYTPSRWAVKPSCIQSR